MTQYYTPIDHVRAWLTARSTWDGLILATVALAGAGATAWQILAAARWAGQPDPRATVTASAGVLLAAPAVWELAAHRAADCRNRAAALVAMLATPVALATAAAVTTTGPAGAPGPWAPILAAWPMVCVAGAITARLSRRRLSAPTVGVDTEPRPSRAEPHPEPAAQDVEPQVTGTKTARLLALAAAVPADDTRTPTALADDLAAAVGMHEATARRLLARQRRLAS